jgi:NDP-sugar pyrophosphorylase family protein
VLSVHYLGEVIQNYFGDGDRFGVEISYLREDAPLGTAGALALLTPVPDTPFVVTNGDVLSDIRYGELLAFHQQNGADATMAVRHYEWQHPFGVVQMHGRNIVGFEEKPLYRSYVNAGIYALNPSALSLLTRGERCDMPTLFDSLREAGQRTIAYPMHEPWLDVGRAEDLEFANESF